MGFRTRDDLIGAIRRVHYIAYTQFEADYVHPPRRGPRPRPVIGAGVDPAQFRAAPADAPARLGLDDGPVVGFIGQIGGHKGVDTLLYAMPEVWESHPDAWLLIAGARSGFFPEVERLDRPPCPGTPRPRQALSGLCP